MPELPSAYYRTQLLDRRQRLQTAAAALEAAQVMALLEEIDAALRRIESGTYGLCEQCHDPIEERTLVADPLARLCLDHMTEPQKRALEEDLEMAVRIQENLLPGRELAAAGWEAAYHYEPAGPVSGDYCDLIPSDAGPAGLFFATGDVSGKGLAASLLMSHLHAIFRSLISVGMPLSELVQRANRLFCDSTLPSSYATLACGFAAASGHIEICNAGHCPPVLVRGGEVATVAATGLPIGLFRGGLYSASSFVLRPGEALVLYTDGLTEARDRSQAEFGADRLLNCLRSHRGVTPRDLAAAIVRALDTFLGGAPKTDDLAILVVTRAAA